MMDELTRRETMKLVTGASLSLIAGCSTEDSPVAQTIAHQAAIIATTKLPPSPEPWPTIDPFLFCVHHNDIYPKGNAELGPNASLDGRIMGRDFAGLNGWRMYHGQTVPGFPSHPHRGFETVTVVRQGFLDHSDSLGSAARYGNGDVQWLTAGAGIQHAEMFPLLNQTGNNPIELFQIWLNLPKANKFAQPHFSMFWNEEIPKIQHRQNGFAEVELTLVAGSFDEHHAPSPPPQSWASQPENDVAIWTLKLSPGAQVTLPRARQETHRSLYFYLGGQLTIGDRTIASGHMIEVEASGHLTLTNGDQVSEVLVLQGRPIGEPVVSHGPFVMNTTNEIHQAVADYQTTRFGGWPWPRPDPVHGDQPARFARHADGRMDEPA